MKKFLNFDFQKIKDSGKQFGLIFLIVLYMEFLFSSMIYSSYLRSSIINIFLFSFLLAVFLNIIVGIFKEGIGKVILMVFTFILGIIFSLQFVFKMTFNTFFSFGYLKLADQLADFGGATLFTILENLYGIILFFLPFILLIIFRKKFKLVRFNVVMYPLYMFLLGIFVFLYVFSINTQKGSFYSSYYLYTRVNNNALNIEKLGVVDAFSLDTYRTIFGFDTVFEGVKEELNNDDEELFEYDYNVLDLNFKETPNNDIKTLNNYVNSISGTKKNKYTGLFEGMNLIYITAESFSELGVREDVIPTLYKLVNSGFVFENFYTSNNLSTIGGEFQSLTGLYADSSTLASFRAGRVSFPYGLGNIFKDSGYRTYAYHNHYYTFQERNKYLNTLGFDNFKGCYNGLEKVINCNQWPESDVEMINATVDEYINGNEPFMTYYMSVSGHYQYSYSSNAMVKKNWLPVESLPYSAEARSYLATQIELDRALGILLQKLEEAGKLDNTVIVLLADHYPYPLSMNAINELSSYTRDSVVEVDSNSLIIWNNKMKTVKVSKTATSIDVIPTVYNLFNLKYDSRIYGGRDILSTTNGLALFKNGSFVTDNGTYFANNGSVIAKNDLMTSDYIDTINSEVSNRMMVSKLIIGTNYYHYLFR